MTDAECARALIALAAADVFRWQAVLDVMTEHPPQNPQARHIEEQRWHRAVAVLALARRLAAPLLELPPPAP